MGFYIWDFEIETLKNVWSPFTRASLGVFYACLQETQQEDLEKDFGVWLQQFLIFEIAYTPWQLQHPNSYTPTRALLNSFQWVMTNTHTFIFYRFVASEKKIHMLRVEKTF